MVRPAFLIPSMRIITLVLAALLLMIQYPLWLGKGGMLAVSDMRDQVQLAQVRTDGLKARNAKLESEVRDLREGTGAVEERARLELGMIKQNEIFVQVLRKDEQPTESMTVPPPPPEPKTGKDGKPLAVPAH